MSNNKIQRTQKSRAADFGVRLEEKNESKLIAPYQSNWEKEMGSERGIYRLKPEMLVCIY